MPTWLMTGCWTGLESADPPALRVLGRDALDRFRAVRADEARELDAWQFVSTSTDSGD